MVNITANSIISIMVAIIAMAVLIYNVIYISSLKDGLVANPNILGTVLTEGGLNVLFWVDIALIVILGLYLAYSLFVLFTSKSDQEKIKEFFTRTQIKPEVKIM